jgi:PAS domain S-box-containing protein
MTEGVMMLDSDLYELFEHTTDAAFAVTDGGEICSWNASAEALFGFRRDEVLGKTCFELLQGRDVLGTLTCKESCHVRECAAHHTGIPDFDLEVNTRASGRIWVNVSTVVFEDPKSGRRRVVHLARSIEDRKKTEAVVQRMLLVSKQLVEVSEHSLRPAPVDTLSEQERRVLRGFSEGKSPADIVRELNISLQTLRNHLHHINQKLGTHNRLEAVTHAIRRKLV